MTCSSHVSDASISGRGGRRRCELDLAAVWSDLRELRRMRIEVIPIRRRDFDESRSTLGELAEAVAREGHVVDGR